MDWGTPAAEPASTSWNSKAAAAGGSGFANSGGSGFDTDHVSKHDGADGGFNACRICGEDGHFARMCPQNTGGEHQNSGECYNCGEVGHNKADCTNPRFEREFTGTCRICEQVSHRASDCPTKPAEICKRCKQEGHRATECTELYDLWGDNVNVIDDADEAWRHVLQADADDDLDDFKQAFAVYCKSAPSMDLKTLQVAFREADMKIWLIAREQEVSSTHTIVNLQGKIDCKYTVAFQYGLAPRRAKMAEGWPKTEEENLERLEDAGFPRDRMIPLCSNCSELGHSSKTCPEEKREFDKPEISCTNCGEKGNHYVRDCPMPRVDKNACRHCGQSGHKAADCAEAPKFACRNCGEEGHRAADCTNERVFICRNCEKPGHQARECPEPKNMANVTCRNCEKTGHTFRDCDQPKDWSKMQCRLCGLNGHGAGRCPNPNGGKQETEATGGFDTAEEGAEEGAASGGDGGWASAPAAAADDWEAAPASVTAGGW